LQLWVVFELKEKRREKTANKVTTWELL